MSDLVVVVPTRVRPHSMVPLLDAFALTCRARTTVVLALDGDPEPARYEQAVLIAAPALPAHVSVSLLQGPRRRMVATLNHAVRVVLDTLDPVAVGYFGDDHRPATVGWDETMLAALAELGTGLVYGDDGHQGANLPTAVVMSADIVRELGYMVAPPLQHMYCDNFWKDLGEGSGCLRYLPEVRITHQHPAVHAQGRWDGSYAESNSTQSYGTDAAAYARYRATALADDIARVRALRERGNNA